MLHIAVTIVVVLLVNIFLPAGHVVELGGLHELSELGVGWRLHADSPVDDEVDLVDCNVT